MLGKIILSVAFILSTLPSMVIAESNWEINARSPKEHKPSFFRDNYFSLEMVRNHPYGTSHQLFTSGQSSYLVGFKHFLRDRWLVGVQSGFKNFHRISTNSKFSLFVIAQETQYILRLSHPFYFSLGPKFMILLPTKDNSIPPEREPEFSREVGLGLTACLHFALNQYSFVTLRADRWRGVDTTKFQGIETAISLNVSLP